VMCWAASCWLSPACWLCMCFTAGVLVLHSSGAHGQVDPDPGHEGRGRLGRVEPTSVRHPSSSQHQPVGAARLRVELQVQLDQAGAGTGGECRHDSPGAGGRTSRLWLWSVHQRCRLTSTASGPPSMVFRSLSILLGRVVNASYIEPWSLRQTVWECFRGRLRGRGRRRLPLGWSAQDRHRSRRRPRRRVASRRRNSGS
jgi:hypothetical protein